MTTPIYDDDDDAANAALAEMPALDWEPDQGPQDDEGETDA